MIPQENIMGVWWSGCIMAIWFHKKRSPEFSGVVKENSEEFPWNERREDKQTEQTYQIIQQDSIMVLWFHKKTSWKFGGVVASWSEKSPWKDRREDKWTWTGWLDWMLDDSTRYCYRLMSPQENIMGVWWSSCIMVLWFHKKKSWEFSGVVKENGEDSPRNDRKEDRQTEQINILEDSTR